MEVTIYDAVQIYSHNRHFLIQTLHNLEDLSIVVKHFDVESLTFQLVVHWQKEEKAAASCIS